MAASLFCLFNSLKVIIIIIILTFLGASYNPGKNVLNELTSIKWVVTDAVKAEKEIKEHMTLCTSLANKNGLIFKFYLSWKYFFLKI